MSWFYLLIAGLFEVAWAAGLKYCEEFKLNFTLIFVIFSMVASMIFLWLATKTIPMGVAYAIWGGIGIIGVLAYDLLILKESISLMNIIFVGFIAIGIIGLKLTTKC